LCSRTDNKVIRNINGNVGVVYIFLICDSLEWLEGVFKWSFLKLPDF
jgi:hypothetical protein